MGLVPALMGCADDGSRTFVTHVNQAPLWSPSLLHWIASSPQGLVMRVAAADDDARWADEAAAPFMPGSSSFHEAVRAAAIAAFPRRDPDEPDLDPVILPPVV